MTPLSANLKGQSSIFLSLSFGTSVLLDALTGLVWSTLSTFKDLSNFVDSMFMHYSICDWIIFLYLVIHLNLRGIESIHKMVSIHEITVLHCNHGDRWRTESIHTSWGVLGGFTIERKNTFTHTFTPECASATSLWPVSYQAMPTCTKHIHTHTNHQPQKEWTTNLAQYLWNPKQLRVIACIIPNMAITPCYYNVEFIESDDM